MSIDYKSVNARESLEAYSSLLSSHLKSQYGTYKNFATEVDKIVSQSLGKPSSTMVDAKGPTIAKSLFKDTINPILKNIGENTFEFTDKYVEYLASKPIKVGIIPNALNKFTPFDNVLRVAAPGVAGNEFSALSKLGKSLGKFNFGVSIASTLPTLLEDPSLENVLRNVTTTTTGLLTSSIAYPLVLTGVAFLGLTGLPLVAVAAVISGAVSISIETMAEKAFDAAWELTKDLRNAGVDQAQAIAEGIAEGAVQLTRLMNQTGQEAAEIAKEAFEAASDFYAGLLDASTEAAEWILRVAEDFVKAIFNASPLVLDLDGDGIELVSLEESETLWDIDQDGLREKSGWVAPDDGLLVLDANGNGRIEDHSELFGDSRRDGFNELSELDSNGDGIISAADDAFSDLQVWQDRNQNGISEANELFSLKDLKIVSLDLNATSVERTNAGHEVTHVSTYTFVADAGTLETRDLHDVWFDYDPMISRPSGAVEIDLALLRLPDLKGAGNVYDLVFAMSNELDPKGTLRSKVEAFSEKGFKELLSDTDVLTKDLRDIIFEWTGVSQVKFGSRGGNVDAQELGALEALMGRKFLQHGSYENPYIFAGIDLDRGFATVYDEVSARLLAQSSAKAIYKNAPLYDPLGDDVLGGSVLSKKFLNKMSKIAEEATDVVATWSHIVRMIEFGSGFDSLNAKSIQALDAAIKSSETSLNLAALRETLKYKSEIGETLVGTNLADSLSGGLGNDRISGGYGDDTLTGGIGADRIDGGAGDDTLIGQTGDDLILGSLGSDTYIYKLGHGTDTYSETGYETDTIRLGKGISRQDVKVSRVSNDDLRISINTGLRKGEIIVEDQFNQGQGRGIIEILEFKDGSQIRLDGFKFRLKGTASDDTLWGVISGGKPQDRLFGGAGDDILRANGPNSYEYTKNTLLGQGGSDQLFGSRGDDKVNGGSGDDLLSGDQGNDTLIGGKGNDAVRDFAGNDTYRYKPGDGIDTIEDLNGDADRIEFGKGISSDDLTMTRLGNDALVIEIDGVQQGTIRVTSQFKTNGAVETLTFSDKTTLDLTKVKFTTFGTATDDTIFGVRSGGSQEDRIYAGDGDDTVYARSPNGRDASSNWLYGELGADTLTGAFGDDFLDGGDGADVLNGEGGNDVLIGGPGDDKLGDFSGDDIYRYSAGDGMDTIQDWQGDADKIAFGTGITSDNLTMTRLGNDTLRIEIEGEQPGRIDVLSHFVYRQSIETLEFADGTVLQLEELPFTTYGSDESETLWGIRYGGTQSDIVFAGKGNDKVYSAAPNLADYGPNTLYGETGDDSLTGSRGADRLFGGADNDTLRGDQGDDVLDGGAGDDTLNGGAGSDEFVYNGGLDIIEDFSTSDKLTFDNSLWSDTELDAAGFIALAEVDSGDVIFEFDATNSLTLQAFDDLNALETLIYTI